MPYCHLYFTRLVFHLACVSISPWCSLLIQCRPLAWPPFLTPPVSDSLVPSNCCCSWNAWNVNWPMSSVGPRDMSGNWTYPLVDHWNSPDSSMSMTNEQVEFFYKGASALVNAPLQISESLGHWNTCAKVSWKCWHLGHLWSIPCSCL